MKRLPALALATAIVSLAASASAAPISRLIVFGDSLSDSGNGPLLTGGTFPPPPYAGRASNGPVAVEAMAAALGVPLTPSAAGGTNFAVVGAATGPVTFAPPSPPITTDNFAAVAYGQAALANTGVMKQVEQFLLSGTPFNPAETLFFVWAGPNDFFINPSAATAAAAVQNIGLSMLGLYVSGATNFFVPNMPDLSLTPYGRSLPPDQQLGLQMLALGFNAGLANLLANFSTLPGVNVTTFDTFALLHALAANPAAFGMTNVAEPCLTGNLGTGGVTCATPETYAFWDSVHPTTATHAILGRMFAEEVAVPEPATMALFGLGLAAVAVRRRARR